ncbi:MAG: glycosyltransferase family 2 protein [Candidatus Bathyarchaeia archaeon]
MHAPRVLVLIPAMNEEEGIRQTIEEAGKKLSYLSLLVVDGNSIDRTVQVAKDLGADVFCQTGRGKGAAIAEGLLHVPDDFDYVVLTDADFTYPIEYANEMMEILDVNPSVGMVLGNRFNGNLNLGKLHDVLYFGNRFIAITHNLLNGVQLRDPLTGLRVVRGKLLKGWHPKSAGFDIEVELNHYIERLGYDIWEVPIHYRDRVGEKKLRFRDGFSILNRIMAEAIR